MPKRASRKTSFPRAALALVGIALVLFAAGEAIRLVRSDAGQLRVARHLGIGDRAGLARLVGRQLHGALEAAGVSPDSVAERVLEDHDPPVVWRVGLAHDASLLQINYAITKRLGDHGAHVASAAERTGRSGERIVAMTVGMPRRETHEIQLVRFPAPAGAAADRDARVAVVLFDFENPDDAETFFDLALPFAVALRPGEPHSQALFRAARKRDREVVLHLPLEPLNYPRANPGPGAILVTMKKSTITGMVKRYIDQAAPVTAVANHMGSLATQDMTVMGAVYDELRRRHLPFIHVLPATGAVCKSLAADAGVSYEEPDAVIDAAARGESSGALDARWAEVRKAAVERGSAVVWIRATPLVRAWLPKAMDPRTLVDVSLVPLTSAIRTPPAL